MTDVNVPAYSTLSTNTLYSDDPFYKPRVFLLCLIQGDDYAMPAYTPPPEDYPPLSEPMAPLYGWEMEAEVDPLPQVSTFLRLL